MAPTLRSSSAQNSPSATSTRLEHFVPATSPTTTPRKAPQCSKCKRPKAGHPRSGCPFTDSPPNGKENATKALEGQLSVALESLVIASPRKLEPDESVKARRRVSSRPPAIQQSESLLSLSTNSNEIIARLMQPGMFDNNAQSTKTPSRIVRWQETIAIKTPVANRAMKNRTPARSPMPGTLIPLTPETGSFASSNTSFAKEENPVSDIPFLENEPVSENVMFNPSQRPQPLVRSMSSVERDLFLSKLADDSNSTIYIIPKVDVDEIVAQATSLRFLTRVIMSNEEHDPNALVILGCDEESVEALYQKVEKEDKTAQQLKNKGRASALRTVAGAAMVGAVGAWAGLAFS